MKFTKAALVAALTTIAFAAPACDKKEDAKKDDAAKKDGDKKDGEGDKKEEEKKE